MCTTQPTTAKYVPPIGRSLASVACRRWCLLLMVLQLLVLLWLYKLLSQSRLVTTYSSPNRRHNLTHQLASGEAVFKGQHLVNTETCQIPNSDAFDVTLRKYIEHPEPIRCDEGRHPTLTYSDMNSVYFVPGRQHLYGAKPPVTTVSCCTRDVSWDSDVYMFKPKKGIKRAVLSKECRPLTDSYTPASATGVEVTCELNHSEVYRDYYHLVPPSAPGTTRTRDPQQVKPSVLIISFDSLSRLQFQRWFPQSRRFLIEQLGAFELAGLNKEGDNTWPNMVPLLFGGSVDDLRAACVKDPKTTHLDYCPFMWKEFKLAGYRTLLFEDSARLGTFTFLKHGFSRQPTDDYSMPTRLFMEKYIGHRIPVNTYFCMGSRPSPAVSLKYASHLARRLAGQPYWAAVIMDSFTHDRFTMPGLLDAPYSRLLESLRDAGALNNTVLVTMGDHGLRYGAARNTLIGGLEERLPLMSLAFPAWMRRLYPQAFANLRYNQRQLTSFRDIHATLLALLRPDEALGAAGTTEADASEPAVSLFQRVSRWRRCADVHIPAQFCTCLPSQPLHVDDSRARDAARLVIATINTLLSSTPQCAPLELRQLLEARLQLEPPPVKSSDGEPARQLIRVWLLTEPGLARLEATVTRERSAMSISGSVDRLDRYGHLVWCIQDHILEKYCHCGAKPAAGRNRTTSAQHSSNNRSASRRQRVSAVAKPNSTTIKERISKGSLQPPQGKSVPPQRRESVNMKKGMSTTKKRGMSTTTVKSISATTVKGMSTTRNSESIPSQ